MMEDNIKISSLFDNVPRMGFSDNLLQLFSLSSSSIEAVTDNEDIQNYVIGLTFISLVVLIITAVWLLVITMLKCCCCCCDGIGFLSGKRFNVGSRNALPIRLIFSLCAVLWIVATSLTVIKGIDHLQGTLQIVETTNANVTQLGIDGASIVNNITLLGVEAAELRDIVVANLSTANFCPAADGNEELLQGIFGENNIFSQRDIAVQYLTELSDFFNDNMETIEDGLKEVEEGTGQFDEFLNRVQLYIDDYLSLSIIIPWILVPSFLLIGVVVASVSATNTHTVCCVWECCLNWLFLPILILQTILSAIMASVLSILAVVNSDFCFPSTNMTTSSSVVSNTISFMNITTMNITTSTAELDGPQLTLMSIAESLGLDETSLTILRYYLSICRTDNPFTVIVDYAEEYIPRAAASITNLTNSIDLIGVTQIETLCGNTNSGFQIVYDLIDRMRTMLSTIYAVVNQVLQLLKCENISPILTTTVNDAVCHHTINALGWSVICFSIITFLGLVMITFRSSFISSTTDAILLEDDSTYEKKRKDEKKKLAMTEANENLQNYDESTDKIYYPNTTTSIDDNTFLTLPKADSIKEERKSRSVSLEEAQQEEEKTAAQTQGVVVDEQTTETDDISTAGADIDYNNTEEPKKESEANDYPDTVNL